MAAGRRDATWDHTAELIAALYNVHRDPKLKKEPFIAADFHPGLTDEERRAAREAAKPKPLPVGIGALKTVFIDRQLPAAARATNRGQD